MVDTLATSIRAAIQTRGCARMQESFLAPVLSLSSHDIALSEKIDAFCAEHGFRVRREGEPVCYIFTKKWQE
jgi:hypothetical protein